MKRFEGCSLLLILCMLAGCASPGDPSSARAALVEAERSFARASEAQGLRSAFLDYLADDAIIFQPTPVNGPAWYRERPEAAGTLAWQPVFADVAASGDFGYTTGPWTFSDTTGTPVAYGHYVSVWKKPPGGVWRVALDAGITHPMPETPPAPVAFPEEVPIPMAEARSDTNLEAAHAALLQADRALAEASSSASHDRVAAFVSVAAEQVRAYREGVFPAVGKAAMMALLVREEGLLSWEPMAASVAPSGELGYTYGLTTRRTLVADSVAAPSSSYLRIWTKPPGDAWTVVLDLAAPIPPTD